MINSVLKLQALFYHILILTGLSLFTLQPADAQDNSNQNSFNLDRGTNSNITYFFDEAGFQLATTASPLDEFIDPDRYRLGAYDVLSVSGQGLMEFNYRGITVNASGDITLPTVGTLSIQGLSLTEAKEMIRNEFEQTIRNTEINITLDRPRPVVVHVGGDVANPGRYIIQPGTRYDALISGFQVEDEVISPVQNIEQTINNQNSSFNRQTITGLNFEELELKSSAKNEVSNTLLSEISKKYDLRLVQVTNNESESRFVDLSAYFNSGMKKFNPYIADGDQINFVERTKERARISISGAVLSPFEGTFRTDDTFEKLVEISGGLSPDADTTSFFIYREVTGSAEKMEFSFGDEVTLQPNDRIIIPRNTDTENMGSVSIEGQVGTPGIFSITEGETNLAQILEMAGGLNEDALARAAYLYRKSYDNRGVNSVSSISPSLLTRSSDQYLEGYDYMRLEEALNTGRVPVDLTDSTLIREMTLSDGDQIFIPKDEHSISLIGQVNSPGFYAFNENISVQDYISKASGYTVAANKERVFVIKAGSRTWYRPNETELVSGDIIFVDRESLVDVNSARNYELQRQQLKNNRIQLVLAAIGTVTGIITTYVAVTR